MIRSAWGIVLAIGLAFFGAADAREYATWNPLDAQAGLSISADGLTASGDSIGDAWASIRTTISVTSGAWYWETSYGYTGAANTAGGVATASLPLALRPGGDHQSAPLGATLSMQSYGGPDKFGDCYVNTSVFANVSSIVTGDTVRHWLDLDAGVYRISVNGASWTIVAKSGDLGVDGRFYDFEGGPWYALAGLHAPVGTSAVIVANFGQEPFVYDVPEGANPGIYVDNIVFGNGFEQ